MNTSGKTPLLFSLFPSLAERIAWCPLGRFPTPVQQLTGFGHDNLWVKRDDQTSPVYGGNKVRKLEFILGDVMARKKSHVVTMGGLGTNHGLATAIFCHRLGLECTLILFEQPVTPFVKETLQLFHNYAANMVLKRSVLGAGAHYYASRLLQPNAYYLYAGGSTPQGTLGFVNAALELKQQIDQGLLPIPDYIFCPQGSNGTVAGLTLGCQLAGLKTQVVGVRVTESNLGPIQLASPSAARKLMDKTHRLLLANSHDTPRITLKPPSILNDYCGEGYGFSTDKGLAAIDLMRQEAGLELEPTYTAKAFAALLDFVATASARDKTILYWHTFSSVDFGQQLAKTSPSDLAPEFQQYF